MFFLGADQGISTLW